MEGSLINTFSASCLTVHTDSKNIKKGTNQWLQDGPDMQVHSLVRDEPLT